MYAFATVVHAVNCLNTDSHCSDTFDTLKHYKWQNHWSLCAMAHSCTNCVDGEAVSHHPYVHMYALVHGTAV